MIISHNCSLSFLEAVKVTLAGGTFNSLVPSKLGDLSRAYFLKQEGKLNLKRGLNSIFLEKLLNFSTLCLLFLIGLTFVEQRGDLKVGMALFGLTILLLTLAWFLVDFKENRLLRFLSRKGKLSEMMVDARELVTELKGDVKRLLLIFLLSLVLWILNFFQIYLFFVALHAILPLRVVFGLVPAAILVEMLPVTISGMGTRDAALILLFKDYADPALVLGVGLLITSRFWILSLLGLPFAKGYLGLSLTGDRAGPPLNQPIH